MDPADVVESALGDERVEAVLERFMELDRELVESIVDGDLLRRTAERARTRPFYLAASLLAYADAERLDDAGLAAQLGCVPASLPALLLCRRPSGEASVLRADVQAIAQRFGLNATRLVGLLRRADALVVHRKALLAPIEGRFLAAARDRDDAETGRPDGTPGEDAP